MASSQTELDIVIKAIDQASDQLKQIASNAGNAMGDVSQGAQRAAQSNDSLTASVFEGVAAWDTIKEAIGVAKNFIEDSIGAYAKASETFAMVKTNVENAGFSFDELGPKIAAHSALAVQMGFENDTAAASLSKLLLITGDYSQSVALSNLAMD